MDKEIKIGREVSGANVVNVPNTCRRVSRRHATLFWNDGIATLEDNESSNGTFVNGKRIAKSRVKETDTVWLGGNGTEEGCYQLDLQKIFASCRDAQKAQRTDYSEEFESLKQTYIAYQHEVSTLKQEATKKSQMPKLIASLVPAIIGLFILIASSDMYLRIIAMSIGSVLSGVVGILTLGKGNAASEAITEEITELQIKYQPHYCCPKCGMKYSLTTHWKKLLADGKCPNPKCDAEFVKHE